MEFDWSHPPFELDRSLMAHEVEEGIEHHEASMTKMGFLFLGIFVAVIAIAALLP